MGPGRHGAAALRWMRWALTLQWVLVGFFAPRAALPALVGGLLASMVMTGWWVQARAWSRLRIALPVGFARLEDVALGRRTGPVG